MLRLLAQEVFINVIARRIIPKVGFRGPVRGDPDHEAIFVVTPIRFAFRFVPIGPIKLEAKKVNF